MKDRLPPRRMPPSRRPAHVLFFAAIPPDPIKHRIAEAWRLAGTGEDFRHDTLHMTVQAVAGFDEPPPHLIDRLFSAAEALRAAPFTLCFDRLMTFNGQKGNRALVLGTDGRNGPAQHLARALHHTLSDAGHQLPSLRKITPHLTLAYGSGFPDARHLKERISWTIADITLIDSLQGQNRHVALGNWPLIEGTPQSSFDF